MIDKKSAAAGENIEIIESNSGTMRDLAPMVQCGTCGFLKAAGYKCQACADPKEAKIVTPGAEHEATPSVYCAHQWVVLEQRASYGPYSAPDDGKSTIRLSHLATTKVFCPGCKTVMDVSPTRTMR